MAISHPASRKIYVPGSRPDIRVPMREMGRRSCNCSSTSTSRASCLTQRRTPRREQERSLEPPDLSPRIPRELGHVARPAYIVAFTSSG